MGGLGKQIWIVQVENLQINMRSQGATNSISAPHKIGPTWMVALTYVGCLSMISPPIEIPGEFFEVVMLESFCLCREHVNEMMRMCSRCFCEESNIYFFIYIHIFAYIYIYLYIYIYILYTYT